MDISNAVILTFAGACLITGIISHLSHRDKPTWFIFVMAALFGTLGMIDGQKLANIKFNAFDGISFEVSMASAEKIALATEISKEDPNLSAAEIKRVTDSSKSLAERKRTDADYLVLAMDAFRSNNHDDELRYAILGLERPSSDVRVKATLLHRYANALKEFEANDKAILVFEQAALVDPSFSWPHNNRGVLLKKLGRDDEALKAYDEAIRINPAYADAHYNRDLLLKNMGEKN